MGSDTTWKPSYSVGNPLLDEQHREILAVIEDLRWARHKGADREAIVPLIERLIKYTATHFRCEEQIMQDRGYPDLGRHKVLHDELRRKTRGLRDHVGLVTGDDLLRFVRDWWVDHIQTEDRQYAPYLEQQPATK